MADGRRMANPEHMASAAKEKPAVTENEASQVLNLLTPKKTVYEKIDPKTIMKMIGPNVRI